MGKPEKQLKSKLSIIYDFIVNEIERIWTAYPHPCHICNGYCLAGWTMAEAKLQSNYITEKLNVLQLIKDNSFCCNGCEHLSRDGCTVKSIPCMLWFCGSNAPLHSDALVRIEKLRNISRNLGFSAIRGDKAQNLALSVAQIKSNSATYSGATQGNMIEEQIEEIYQVITEANPTLITKMMEKIK